MDSRRRFNSFSSNIPLFFYVLRIHNRGWSFKPTKKQLYRYGPFIKKLFVHRNILLKCSSIMDVDELKIVIDINTH